MNDLYPTDRLKDCITNASMDEPEYDTYKLDPLWLESLDHVSIGLNNNATIKEFRVKADEIIGYKLNRKFHNLRGPIHENGVYYQP